MSLSERVSVDAFLLYMERINHSQRLTVTVSSRCALYKRKLNLNVDGLHNKDLKYGAKIEVN